ncbi:MAG TPA: hypothetical protein VH539_10630 [Gemmatimonadaceae bacterium]|jgi:hypothetical protein
MADRDRKNRPSEPDDESASPGGKDVMRGRSFAGANIANTERDQTRERQRIAEHGGENLDEYGEVTDAEIEAREERRAERNED